MVPPNGDNREAPVQHSVEESPYHQQWPIMVEEPDTKKGGKGLLLLLVLLVVAAGGAVAGFIMFKDKVLGPRGSSAGSGSGSPNRPAAADPRPQAQPTPGMAQGGGKPPSPGTSQSPETTTPATGPAAGPGDSGKPQQPSQSAQPAQSVQATEAPQATQPAQATGAKLTSLQAASFPNQASAKQFQDRLTQAGLPAYIVAADIPHRGRWFRVRAGKFASQEEARQTAESWRKRAAAAGINLQLVPCEAQ